MSHCPIDHSQADVIEKLESQQAFLPERIFEGLKFSLPKMTDQDKLNDIFHLLKKYDLVEEKEQKIREQKMLTYI